MVIFTIYCILRPPTTAAPQARTWYEHSAVAPGLVCRPPQPPEVWEVRIIKAVLIISYIAGGWDVAEPLEMDGNSG